MAWWWVVLLTIGLVSGCTRADEPGSVPGPVATSALRLPTPVASPTDVEDEGDDEDEDDEGDEFNKPWSDFEIDADASSYSGYVPKQVAFVAKALNGTPPFTYAWDFGDGSPPASGESVVHVFTKLGKVDVFVNGTDGAGRTSRVQMVLYFLTLEDYAARKNLDPETLPTIAVPPTPIAAPSP